MNSEFKPDLTPDQMEALGVLASQYYNADPKTHNFFKVDASMKKWPDEWKKESAPMGWFDWYKQYSAGIRSADDERQIKRWLSFKSRHLAQLLKADPTGEDFSIQPRRRQALLNWGIAPGLDKNKYLDRINKV
jgi:hypothetical protein